MKADIKYKMMNIHEKINFRDEAVKFKNNIQIGVDFITSLMPFFFESKIKPGRNKNP